MAETITIEGSRTPSVELATGERRTVRRTERIDRLIARGFVTVVEDAPAAPAEPEPAHAPAEPEPVLDDVPEPAKPVRNSRTAAKDTSGPATDQ